jgi:mono/diheme cytochrome c family protein
MKILKVLGVIVGIILLFVIGFGVYLRTALPNTGPASDIKIEVTPERVERGRYLAHHVSLCVDCHSTRDWTKYSAPMTHDNIGGGGEVFDERLGFPGKFYAPNITPYKLANWTDGEILRAVTTGVSKDGHALFPIMGYHRFGKMDEEDVKSIIAYIRTLSPIQTSVPKSEPKFVFSFILNTIPKKAEFSKRPSPTDHVAYGKYIINAAGCVECHSKREKGEVVPGTEFGGGMEFILPTGTIKSPNITMDRETGIGSWTKDVFLKRFKAYADSSYVPRSLAPNEINTPMPWTMLAKMKEEDLSAIYDFLITVKPLKNKVERYVANQ